MFRFSPSALAGLSASLVLASGVVSVGCTSSTSDTTASPAGPPALLATPLSCNAASTLDGGDSFPVVPYERDDAWYVALSMNPVNTSTRPSGDCGGLAQCGHLVANASWSFADQGAPVVVTTVAAGTTIELPVPLPHPPISAFPSITASVTVRVRDDYEVELRDPVSGAIIEADVNLTLLLHGSDGSDAAVPMCH